MPEIRISAANTQAALDAVRKALGRDAVIVNAATLKGIGGRPDSVEITASNDPAAIARADTGRAQAARYAASHRARAALKAYALNTPTVATNAPTAPPQLAEIRQMVEQLAGRSGLSSVPTSVRAVQTRLEQAGVSPERAGEITRRLILAGGSALLDENAAVQGARDALAAQLATGGVVEPKTGARRVIALVGPTGAGKTTTLMKLGAQLRMAGGTVGMISTDSYRPGATDQLTTVANILGSPLRVADSPSQLRAALDDMPDRDTVLLDTAGISPRDGGRTAELTALLAQARPDATHFVTSAAADPRQLAGLLESVRGVITNLLLTKLDEAALPGPLVDIAKAVGLPISYTAAGQRVPYDLQPADGRALVSLVLGLN